MFSFIVNNVWFYPSIQNSGSDRLTVPRVNSAEDSGRERVKKTVLGRLARKRFEAMLRGLSGKRGEIAQRMAFSLEHAEAANEESDGALSPPSIAAPSRVPQ